MKVKAFATGLFIVAFILNFQAFGRTYVDDMSEFDMNRIKQYSGFIPHRYSLASGLSDKTVFQFENTGNPSAWAMYRVNDATRVSVAIYSNAPCGTFYSPNPQGGPGEYIMGLHPGNVTSPVTPSMKQALLSQSTNSVYANDGGSLKQLYYDSATSMYLFRPVSQPAGDLIGFGVNIYHSQNGINFTRVQPVLADVSYVENYGLCYEEYTAAVPSSALYIKVELNDIAFIPASGNEWVPDPMPKIRFNQETCQFMSLASVTIYGVNLTLGEQEPLELEPHDPPLYDNGNDWFYYLIERLSAREEPATPRESAALREPAVTPGPVLEEVSRQETPKSESAPKFSGTITQPPPSGRTQPSSAQSEPELKTVPDALEIIPQPMNHDVFEIPREPAQENGFSRVMTGYIAAVMGAIVLISVMPKKQG